MKIRKSIPEDIDALMEVYNYAKAFMKQTGNTNQWINGYPSREVIMQDIEEGNSYVCLDDADKIAGAFYFRIGNDPTYTRIDNGKWLNDKPYGVVHRMAGNGKIKGLGNYCFDWCFNQCKNIRVDTHEDNKVMQHILLKNGYTQCGIIYVRNGTPRIAFQKYEEK